MAATTVRHRVVAAPASTAGNHLRGVTLPVLTSTSSTSSAAASSSSSSPATTSVEVSASSINISEFYSSFSIWLWLLAFCRVLSALYCPIQDCDETFNYWDPLHFVSFGRGLQTWEYAPNYGLRSYLYILIYKGFAIASYIPLVISGFFETYGKIAVFYGVRLGCAAMETLAESYFIAAASARLSEYPSTYWIPYSYFIFSIFSPAMFHASTAFLPQSFTMCFFMLALAAWMQRRYIAAIASVAICTFIGWPFALVAAIPIAIETFVVYFRKLHVPIFITLLASAACIVPSIFIDYLYYQRFPIFAILNIALYNIQTGSDEGANLYGKEPLSYYLNNLFINFNFIAPLAAAAPVVAGIFITVCRPWMEKRKQQFIAKAKALDSGNVLQQQTSEETLQLGAELHQVPNDPEVISAPSWLALRYFSPLFIWCFVMFRMPHKEERFLYLIYPLINLAGAYTMSSCIYCLSSAPFIFCPKKPSKMIAHTNSSEKRTDNRHEFRFHTKVWLTLLSLPIALLSISRILALIAYYSAPLWLFNSFYLKMNLPSSTVVAQPTNTASWADNLLLNSKSAHFEDLRVKRAADVDVCIGKEWYRFPSSFFLPEHGVTFPSPSSAHSSVYSLKFLESEFGGLLPAHYEEREDRGGAARVTGAMNEKNRKEQDRFVDLQTCEFIVDLDLPTQRDPHYDKIFHTIGAKDENGCEEGWEWLVWMEYPFLDAAASKNALARAFYIPIYSERHNVFRPYRILKRVKSKRCS